MPNNPQPPPRRPSSQDIFFTSIRSEIFNPDDIPSPSANDESNHHLISGPFSVPTNGQTASSLRLSHTVAPFTTLVLRTLHPENPQQVLRETVVRVSKECQQMFDNARIMTDVILCIRQERNDLYRWIRAVRKKIRRQKREFERGQMRLMEDMERVFGGRDAEELLGNGWYGFRVDGSDL
ncbi:hypothetical protein BZA77DRAFT_289959 [Pyronema omphalodes]|nr:hypothetical protein BZA77DRAFT_289959 [Pyronema omphalodes]